MSNDQFETLVGWHRDTQKRLGQLQFMVGILFAAQVVSWFVHAGH